MKPSITSINDGQKEQCVRVITDATRKAMGVAIDELVGAGVINTDNLQRVLSRGNELVSAITSLVKEELAEIAEGIFGYVRLISGAETLTLEPTDGTETIAQAADFFTAGIDRDFKNWGCDVPSKPTGKMNVQVYEMITDGTFADVFGGLSDNTDTLCLTQHQIIQFVKKHCKWLRADGYATFIPFKVGNDLFVACVALVSGGRPLARVFRFSGSNVWSAENHHWFVVLQLALKP